jgi:hypothetical protein
MLDVVFLLKIVQNNVSVFVEGILSVFFLCVDIFYYFGGEGGEDPVGIPSYHILLSVYSLVLYKIYYSEICISHYFLISVMFRNGSLFHSSHEVYLYENNF